MVIEILTGIGGCILANLPSTAMGAGAGQGLNLVWQWATKEFDKKNHVVEKALQKAYLTSLEVIKCKCQGSTYWQRDQHRVTVILEQLKSDASEILQSSGSGQLSQNSLIPANENAIEYATRILMAKLESQDKWLGGEAPGWLKTIIKDNLIPIMVYQFRWEMRHEATLFRTLVYDLLQEIGGNIADIENIIGEIQRNLDNNLSKLVQADQDILATLNDINKKVELLASPLHIDDDFQTIIDRKTEGFVKREWVFTEIANFLNSHTHGYFIIEAPPGMGKSAIIAKYIKEQGCIGYFNIIEYNKTSPFDFLRSVCTLLIKVYQLDEYPLPLADSNTRDGILLLQLLTKVSGKLGPGQKLVIAVDALDEVNDELQPKDKNILFLPGELPNHVYFVLSKRPEGISLKRDPKTPVHTLNMIDDKYQHHNAEDIEYYIRGRATLPELLAKISQAKKTVDEVVTALKTRSESNFMYLLYVLLDIEKGDIKLDNLDALPKGLQAYYLQHWQRMEMDTEEPHILRLKVIYCLTKTPNPIPCSILAKAISEPTTAVQNVLKKWEGFVHKQPIEDKSFFYSIYHASFRDFLYSQEMVQAVKEEINLDNMENLIKNSLKRMVPRDG